MSFTDEYYAIVEEQKKKKKEQKTGDAFTDAYNAIVAEHAYDPVATLPDKGSSFASIDIAPLGDMVSMFGPKITPTTKKDDDEDRKWFDTGAFDDGYQFGDVFKTILGTATDVAENIGAGIVGMGEKALDAIAYVSPLLAKGQFYQNGGEYMSAQTQKMFNESNDAAKKWSADFIKKDLYDEEEVAKKIVLGTDKNSVLGEKSDALIQSGGQLLGTMGLQAVGVPWWVSYGVTTFGEESANAMNQGATYSEAGASAAISAAAEVLTEKLSGGITFGGKAVSDVVTSKIARGISNKYVRTLMALGVDAIGEGAEELITADIQKFGQWLTYRDEEELKDLLFSEEAMDEKIEAFIGGAVLGGGVSTVNAVSSARKGVDYASKLTTDEKSVVDKVYQDRVAEAEKNGKIADKQKSRIYDQVRNDLENGYISIETIEEVLGDKDYQTYKETFDSEEAIRREYEELGKKQNATLAEQSRYTELEWKMRYLDKYSTTDALKNRLSEAVQQKVQGSRLVESYNERSRRGQAYEADISKYDEKQRETIQKAIDSGILNNTNRTHEFVDMIAKITADKGVLFDFTNNEKLKESGFAVDGKEVNGFLKGDTITLNMDSAKARNSVVGHEITHVLEGTELYQTLQDTVIEYAKAKGDYQGRYDALAKLYEGVEGADINAELTADLVGDYLFTDTDFVRNLSVQHRNVFQKIYDEIKYLCKVATAGSKEARELEKVKKVFEDAYRSSGNTGSGVKYSLENGKDGDYNKRSRYSETETVFLRWENGSAPIGEVKRFVRYGKVHYYEKTENGCVELSKSQYNERSGLDGENIDRRAEREIGKTDDYDVSSQRGTLGNPDSHRDTAGNASVFGQTVREELQHDTGRGTSSHAGYDNRNNLNLSEEAPDNSDASFFDTFSNDYATVRNYMKDGDTTEDDKHPKFSLSEPVESYAEIEKKRQELYQREMHLEERKREASNNPELLNAMDEASSLFSELRTLLPKRRNGTATQEELNRIEEIKVDRDENIRRVAEIQEALGLGAMEAEAREIRETKEALRAASDAAWEREGAERENKAIEKAGLTAPEYFRKKALKAFKTTTNFNEAGYLLPDGKMLNFSGGERNHRYRDHREIGEIYEATNGVKALNRFLSDGNIRVMAESPGIDIASGVEPTNEQYAAIRKFVNSHGTKEGKFFVDFSSVDGARSGNYAYDGRVRADRVINDIKHYYATGEIREQSDIGRFLSLSNLGEEANADSLRALKLETAPVQETVSKTETAAENATVEENLFPDDAYAPIADDPARFDSLDDRDMPPEREAPYSEEQTEYVDDPFDDRDFYEVGKRNVKAYMYENPEVKPFFQEEALMLGSELADTIKAERWYNDELYSQTGGQKGFGGNKRLTSDSIATLLDDWGMSYADIEKGINAIVEDHGAENIAAAKKIEFMLNDRLMNGYKNFYEHGYVEPNAAYLDLLYEKQINEYSKEAFDAFMANADQYAPPVVEDIAPVAKPKQSVPMQAPVAAKAEAPTYDAQPRKGVVEGQQSFIKEEPAQMTEEERAQTRKQLHQGIVDNIKATFKTKGFDFDKVLKNAKNLSTFSTVDNTPQRVMEKALGYKEGQILGDLTVNKVAQNETTGIKWLNKQVDTIKEISKQYGIKPGSKQSAAAQMYAEGFYVAENNDIIKYGDAELAKDFPDIKMQQNIKRLANDPRIRRIYDETLDAINASRTRNAYPEIPKLDNYFLHFRAMDDTFSRLGLPFNPNDIRAKDLPTDLNGVTADLKPGQPYFSSAMHRRGKRTSFDMLGGLERYLNSAKNQIYHIDDIQTLRALRNYLAETYGQASGLENLDMLSNDEAQERIEQVYNSHLSTFAKFLNEEANVIAGKTALIDRGLEGIIGRRGMTFMNSLNGQVGSNMVGFNISSSLTNFLPVAQTFAKTNKFDFTKAFAQTVANKLSGGRLDNFAKDSPVIIRRKGSDRFYRTPWQKAGDIGYAFMSAVDDISTEMIARTKYNEFVRKGMDTQKAHFETDKWVSRLMGDRSLGQMPQLYNSKMLGLFTKFQLEVRNQLDSQFYDTFMEAEASSEHIENGLLRNAKIAAKVTSTLTQLAVVQHLYGKAFESIAGYNPAFDIIEVLMTAFGYDDDEDSEDTVLDNLGQGLLALAEDLPYTSTFTGGRIPISSALPDVGAILAGEDEYGNEIGVPNALLGAVKDIAPYYLMPGGYGQFKKTKAGLEMYSDEHPIAGSYTDSGNLRFPVEDAPLDIAKAAIFGQYASENARKYFDGEERTLNQDQTKIFAELDMPIEEYWEYRDRLNEFYDYKDALSEAAKSKTATVEDILKSKYIGSVYSDINELYKQQKEYASGSSLLKSGKIKEIQQQMSQMLANSKRASNDISVSGMYAEVGDRRFNYYKDKDTWYEIKEKNADGSDNWYYTQEQLFRDKLGVSYADYWNGKFDPAKNHVKTHYGEMNSKRYNYSEENNMWYEIKPKNDDGTDNWYYQMEQDVTKALGLSYPEYWDNREEYNFAYEKPENYAVARAVGGYEAYKVYNSDLYDIKADKDEYGKSINGSRKEKVRDYINNLDADYYTKIILWKSEYPSDDSNNYEIIDYLNGREDLSFEETVAVLRKLGFGVTDDGAISWK